MRRDRRVSGEMNRPGRDGRGKRLFFGGMMLLCVYLGLLLVDQQIQIQDLSRQKREILQKTEEIYKRNVALREEADRLKNPSYVERVAREKLGLAREDEIVYRIVLDRYSRDLQNASTPGSNPTAP